MKLQIKFFLQFLSQIFNLKLVQFAFFLALRYLRTPRQHRLAQFTALAAIAGIACGVAAMILAQALSNGFRQEMQEKILQSTAHITIFRRDETEIYDYEDLCNRIETTRFVKKAAPTTFDSALLIGKINSSYAILRGGEEVQSSKSKSQNPNQNAIIIEIGKVLAEKTGLKTGDCGEIVSGAGNIGENFAPVSTAVEVGGTFETGIYEYDSTWIRVGLADEAKLTGKSFPSATAIAVEASDIYKSPKIAAEIAERFGADYKVLDWQEANRPLFAALALERRIGLLVIGLIILVAALNITTTLALIVNERRFDIAVLKTCGAKWKSIVQIFLFEGLIIGAIGIFSGVILSLAACFFINYFGLINLPPDVYELNRISLKPYLIDVVLTITIVFGVCLLATIVPARMAARVRPSENLKN